MLLTTCVLLWSFPCSYSNVLCSIPMLEKCSMPWACIQCCISLCVSNVIIILGAKPQNWQNNVCKCKHTVITSGSKVNAKISYRVLALSLGQVVLTLLQSWIIAVLSSFNEKPLELSKVQKRRYCAIIGTSSCRPLLWKLCLVRKKKNSMGPSLMDVTLALFT